jgi:hypothetical protein
VVILKDEPLVRAILLWPPTAGEIENVNTIPV